MKSRIFLSGIIIVCLAISIASTSFEIKIFYYQTSPMRLIKAEAELGYYLSSNCTENGMKRYVKFIRKTFVPGAYLEGDLKALTEEEIVNRLFVLATQNEKMRFKYDLIEEKKESAIIRIMFETNKADVNKRHNTKGEYYSNGEITYKLIKENGRWFISERGNGRL